MSVNTPSNDRIATLDLLRLVSALAVVGFHFLFRGAAGSAPSLDVAYPDAAPYAIFGYLGLNLFFMISGFVIAWSAEGRSFTDFAIARFARLYPGFVACMTVTFCAMMFAADPRFPATTMQYLANLVMVSPALGQPFMDGVYWTIILEMVFYGWVALAIVTGLFDRWRLMLVTGWLALAMLNEHVIGSGALRFLCITEYAPFFATGILVHHISTRGKSAEAAMLMLAAVMISLTSMTRMQGWMLEHYGVALSNGQLIISGLSLHALLIVAVAARRHVAPSTAIAMLGGLTYPLYLLHQNIGYLGINALAPETGKWAALPIVLAALLLASWGVWRFAERPGRRWIVSHLNRAVTSGQTAFDSWRLARG